MKIKKQQFICALISLFIFLSIVMAIGYSINRVNANAPTPFEMSHNYEVFTKTTSEIVNFDRFIDTTKDHSITIISLFNNENYYGIYDPRDYFSYENHIIDIGYTRYFSLDDYQNQTKSGISVNLDSSFVCPKETNTDLVEDVIFCISPNSSLYFDGLQYIINLSSLGRLGDEILIDKNDGIDTLLIEEKLIDLGYEHVPKKNVNVTESLYTIFLIGNHERILLISILLLYIILAFVMYFHFLNNRRILSINNAYGSSALSIFMNMGWKFFLFNLINVISYLLYIVYSSQNLFRYLSILDFSLLLFFHITFTSLLYILVYVVYIKKHSGGVYDVK